MSLPWHIEHVLAKAGQVRGELCYRGATQTILPAVSPGTRVSLQIVPPLNVFAWLNFGTILSSQIVPGAWTATIILEGNISFDGTVTQAMTNNSQEILPNLVIVTRAKPLRIVLVNNSVLAQYVEQTLLYLEIPTEDNFKAIQDILQHKEIII